MKTLEKGKDKIQKICDVLRTETLEPAKKEAEAIIDEARKEKELILKEARKEAESLIHSTRASLEQEKNVFQSSLVQAGRQGIEAIRQEIEHNLFNDGLSALINKELGEPKVVAKLIETLINAVEKEGIQTDLAAIVAKSANTKAILSELSEGIVKRLKDNSLQLGHFAGGAKLQLVNKRMTLDVSDEALKEILATYVRKDFRKLIFSA